MEIATQNTPTLPLTLTDVDGNTINIIVRKADGYVDATVLCQAMGKEWRVYYKAKSTKQYLLELAKMDGLRVDDVLIPIGTGTNTPLNSGKCLVELGRNQHQHTWVSPDVAIHLAQWASPKFGVAVSKLVQRFQTGQVTTAESIAASHQLAEQIDFAEDEPTDYDRSNLLQDRCDAIHVTKAKNDLVKQHIPRANVQDYAVLANSANQIAMRTTLTTKKFKEANNIPSNYSLPDVMDSVALNRRTISESGMAIWMRMESKALCRMTPKERTVAYKERQANLQKATDILDPRKPSLISIEDAKKNKSELNMQRKNGTIQPSISAQNTIQF